MCLSDANLLYSPNSYSTPSSSLLIVQPKSTTQGTDAQSSTEMAESTTIDELTVNDIATADGVVDEPCLAPQLHRALDDLETAVYSVNCFQTTSHFLHAFSQLDAQPLDIQRAVERVTQFAQAQDYQAAVDVQKAQATFGALSNQDQYDLMRYYGEDLLVYLEITIPSDLSHDPTQPFNDLQVSVFDIENLHRALARVRGVEANMADVFFRLPSIQGLMRKNREEELRLLKLRTAAENLLCEQFLALSRGEQDLLWLWYENTLRASGIQKDKNAEPPYSVTR
ncbi:hypothetical protein N7457_004012 [Penicillium paradoxum]|uniref:uncharacterized protein n=1 Tax=Penicillium paradoxum TaxID=176176 RepID=UPI0025469705|nr:uncharacterized protein N7457_004012 [Penicillium paradoxum]KAJ5782238.1 hypothetical protein N7457_004012 [Penicillium paradoxum]